MAYLIWSIEHTAWWRPDGWGYTSSLAEAGRYEREEAERIVRSANVVEVHECLIPDTAVAPISAAVSAAAGFPPMLDEQTCDEVRQRFHEFLTDPKTADKLDRALADDARLADALIEAALEIERTRDREDLDATPKPEGTE